MTLKAYALVGVSTALPVAMLGISTGEIVASVAVYALGFALLATLVVITRTARKINRRLPT